ncbi:MAG: glycogen/starch synthase [Candidatus Neomarinimicrobiota bacterium]
MIKRIYFLTSEIIPFAENYSLANFSKEIPIVFNERKFDFRLMMPKYHFISERRYILREVIRLREMDLKYRNVEIKASVKSAFIPNTKVQVYFLEHESFYSCVQPSALYKQEDDKIETFNSIRNGYFAASALITLNYLRWKPEVIILNDWQMSMIPLLIHSDLLNKEYFDGVKILQILHSKNPASAFSVSEYAEIGLNVSDSPSVKNGKLDCVAAALPYCDHVMISNGEENLIRKYQDDPVFKDLFAQNKKKISTCNLKGGSPEEWQNIADEIIKIIERL